MNLPRLTPLSFLLSLVLLAAFVAFPFAVHHVLAQPAPDAGVVDSSGSGSGAGSGSAVTPTPTQVLLEEARLQITDLRAKYDLLKNEKDPATRLLLYAGLMAAALKLLLDLVNYAARSAKLKSAMAWIAAGLAVPIALLSHYAAGASWFDSIVYAASGPGAVVVHELVSYFTSKQQPAPAGT